MDFAKSHLQSFGWREGMGLGKSENGIKSAVKPKLKFDNHGFGFDINQSMTNDWTTQAFNLAAIGLKFKLTQTQSGVKLKNNSKTNFKSNEKKTKNYSNFVKSSETNDNCDQFIDEEIYETKKIQNIDFDDLFRRNEGITGHKAARIGLKMNAKLKRIEEQEKDFINKTKKFKTND
jgi:hypothetical protein